MYVVVLYDDLFSNLRISGGDRIGVSGVERCNTSSGGVVSGLN